MTEPLLVLRRQMITPREIFRPNALLELLFRLGSGFVRLVALIAIWLYRNMVSKQIRSRRCRFTPTCSQYAQEAIARHGLVTGGFMAYRRLRRCGPEDPGGYDPVP